MNLEAQVLPETFSFFSPRTGKKFKSMLSFSKSSKDPLTSKGLAKKARINVG